MVLALAGDSTITMDLGMLMNPRPALLGKGDWPPPASPQGRDGRSRLRPGCQSLSTQGATEDKLPLGPRTADYHEPSEGAETWSQDRVTAASRGI